VIAHHNFETFFKEYIRLGIGLSIMRVQLMRAMYRSEYEIALWTKAEMSLLRLILLQDFDEFDLLLFRHVSDQAS